MPEWHEDDAEPTPALGAVVERDRGSLPFALIHGESLVACAAWALGEAGVTAVDLGTGWAQIAEAGEPFVLHDPLCPMTPAAFVRACVDRAVETGRVVVGVRPVSDTLNTRDGGVVVGVRPVTDTVKTVDDGVVGATLDRDELRQVASPIVLPAAVVAGLDGLPDSDFATLVDRLREDHEVEQLTAPASARRVSGEEDLRVLEALTEQA